MAFFWIAALIGVGLLLVAALYLVVLNFSDEMYPRLLSAIGIGVITFLVAVLVSLRGSREDAKFTTTMVWDETTHRPPLLWPDPDHALIPTVQRMMDLASLTAEVKETPQSSEEISSYCGELWQYKLLTDLRDIQRKGTGISQALGSSVLAVTPGQAIVKLPDQAEIPPSQFVGYDTNRFSKTEGAAIRWEMMGGLRAPLGTKVELQRRTGPEKHIIRLSRKDYFTFEITVEPIMGGAIGRLPEGLRFLDQKPHSLTTYIFDVTMTANFEKMTAGNWHTEHYKRWISWLMAELARNNREG